jgi:hypothetical protein
VPRIQTLMLTHFDRVNATMGQMLRSALGMWTQRQQQKMDSKRKIDLKFIQYSWIGYNVFIVVNNLDDNEMTMIKE